MNFFRAEETDSLVVRKGEPFQLESLRETVRPPHLLLRPFIQVTEGVTVERKDRLAEDGVHGCVYTIVADRSGDIVIGFEDAQSKAITRRLILHLKAR